MPDILILDYGMGNIQSVRNAFAANGCHVIASRRAGDVARADALVVPGVGSFGDCMANLRRYGLREPILDFIRSGKPYLGLCLGLQILFPSSEESDAEEGLGIIQGRVRKFTGRLKTPHMGWNTIELTPRGGHCPLFTGVGNGSYVYFVHSYFAEPADGTVVAAETEYGARFASAVWRDNIIATQFHPEKSQQVGLKMISNFLGHIGTLGNIQNPGIAVR